MFSKLSSEASSGNSLANPGNNPWFPTVGAGCSESFESLPEYIK